MPLKVLLRVKLRRLTGEHISKNILSSKIPDYSCQARVLCDASNAFCERTCVNTRTKGGMNE